MATTTGTINRAFRLLATKATGQVPDAEQMETALEVLNAMLAGFIAKGWQYVHVPLGQGEIIPLAARHDTDLAHLLAGHLLPELGRHLAPDDKARVESLAEVAERALERALSQVPPLEYPSGFGWLGSVNARWDLWGSK